MAAGNSVTMIEASKKRGFRRNPLIRGRGGLRGIGSTSIVNRSGGRAGILAVASTRRQEFDLHALVDIALVLGDTSVADETRSPLAPAHDKAVLLDALADGVVVLDATGLIVRHNTAAANLLAQSADADLVGSNVVHFLTRAEVVELEAQFQESVDAPPAPRISKLRRTDGSELVAEVSVTVLPS